MLKIKLESNLNSLKVLRNGFIPSDWRNCSFARRRRSFESPGRRHRIIEGILENVIAN